LQIVLGDGRFSVYTISRNYNDPQDALASSFYKKCLDLIFSL